MLTDDEPKYSTGRFFFDKQSIMEIFLRPREWVNKKLLLYIYISKHGLNSCTLPVRHVYFSNFFYYYLKSKHIITLHAYFAGELMSYRISSACLLN